MSKKILNDAEQYVRKNRMRMIWRKVVQFLACVVVFCTTYALILPAITMKQSTSCGLEEHLHTDKCFRHVEVFAQQTGSPEDSNVPSDVGVDVSGNDMPIHQYNNACYETCDLICEMQEHAHNLECFSDFEADVETTDVWERTLTGMNLSGVWAEDVVTIAKSQMGYTESTKNYKVMEDGSKKGYTRYGQWYENPYGDWNAMFAAFCINYAGVEDMPLNGECSAWIEELSAKEYRLYKQATKYDPLVGDLLFLDENGDGVSDRVGIVVELISTTDADTAKIKTIQGDVQGQVQYVTYETEDQQILGYGMLPKQQLLPQIFTYSDRNISVEVELPKDSEIPEDAILKVTPIESENEDYDHLFEQAEAVVDGSVKQIRFYDISFYTADQVYIPVSNQAKVTMRFNESVTSAETDTVVLHYDEQKSNPIVLEGVSVEEQTVSQMTTYALNKNSANTVIIFNTNGFSVFAVVDMVVSGQNNLVTNLDGKLMMIVAVNNDSDNPGSGYNPHRVLTSQVIVGDDGATCLTSSDVDWFNIDASGKVTITDDDYINAQTGNRSVWEFEAAEEPGTYYIRAANFYSKPDNIDAGRYLRIYGRSLYTMDTEKQAFEVVRYHTESREVKDVVCLRAKVSEAGNVMPVAPEDENPGPGGPAAPNNPAVPVEYYYVQLGGNYSTWNIFSSHHFGTPNATVDYPGNHFVLVELDATVQEGALVKSINDRIDQLPSAAEFNDEVSAKGNFDAQVAYRKYLRELAMSVKKDYDNLSDEKLKNFIGEKRITKLEELEWLWRENPKVVPGVKLDATVKLFNYTESINNGELKNTGFEFYSWDDPNKVVDHTEKPADDYTAPVPVMEKKLLNGYPAVKTDSGNVSMKYLFDDTHLKGTMPDGGGFFQQKSNGYYYYYSDNNAAWYDAGKNEFVLYDVVVYPEYTRYETEGATGTYDENDCRSNFFPFNPVIDNIIYHHDDERNTVISSVDQSRQPIAYQNAKTDLWFGMTIEYDFFIPQDAKVNNEDMVFKFHGDDDVFVYIDDVLVLDIGGTHGARDGSINFTTGAVSYQVGALEEQTQTVNTTLSALFRAAGNTEGLYGDRLADYTKHNLKFFYLERGGTYSYCGIEFNMPSLPENTIMVGKELSAGGEYIDAGLDYRFRVVQADNREKSFIKAGSSYVVYENGTLSDKTGQVDENGYFTLKQGQTAFFFDINEKMENTNASGFIVQESMPTNTAGQYSMVSYENEYSAKMSLMNPPVSDGTHGKVISGDTTIYQTNTYSVDSTKDNYAQMFIFTNETEEQVQGTLKITKLVGENTEIDSNREFSIQVKKGSKSNPESMTLLPVGTTYKLWSADGLNYTTSAMTESGVIKLKVGQMAEIGGFLADTYWQITEILTEDEQFTPVYSAITKTGSVEESGRSGIFGVNDIVEATITNYPFDFLVTIPINKQAFGNTGNATFQFDVQQVEKPNINGEGMDDGTNSQILNGSSITVTNDEKAGTNIVIGYNNTEERSQIYYKISEKVPKQGENFIYDETFYIVEVTITEEGSEKRADITKVWKNGTEEVSTPLSFANYKVGMLTVKKQVVNNSDADDTGGSFSFKVTVQLDNTPFLKIPEGQGYKVSDTGEITFELSHEKSVSIPIPLNASVTVTESSKAGYSTGYQINGGGIVQGSTTGAITMNVESMFVEFINQTGYELPRTGGIGTLWYPIGGLVLLTIAFISLYIKKPKNLQPQ